MLTIIIPTKNRRSLLERALDSVFSQKNETYKVVVVNDGSTDSTRDYLDSIKHPKIQVINHSKSLGVNAARNTAFKLLEEGDWALPLDDDDFLLPDAINKIEQVLSETPSEVEILSFNTIMRTKSGEVPGGYNFAVTGEKFYIPTYEAFMTGKGWHMFPGTEGRPIFKWTLFPKYLFNEAVNGFEGEWWLKVIHDGVNIRYVPPQIIGIDWAHPGEHLSDTAARYKPDTFARAHRQIFSEHKQFLLTHPQVASMRALAGFKVALRALNLGLVMYFIFQYLHARFRSAFPK
jgi:glycosyltransferase involved in cell wall biosynthesis